MTLGRREYSEADMMRMQRDAEERVREMQNRARQTVAQDNTEMPQRNRNWNSGPNMRRPNRRQGQQQNSRQHQPEREPPVEPAPPVPPPEPVDSEKKTTIIGDIMNALGMDEDYLLIIGLLLILINQRADTTLILALAYLLI